jgi:lipoate-protein ligase A
MVEPATRMRFLDLTLPSPEENLACDEALLELCEAANDGGVLRVYESAIPCVVVGYGNSLAAEVNLASCAAAGVSVLRRISGGGTVVLGPGCLAYAVVAPIAARPEFANVTATNRFFMEKLRGALTSLGLSGVEVHGHTDLALRGRKFSGNAQRRRRNMLLFHGTLLLEFDLTTVSRLLPMPSQQPEYRKGRSHADFLANADVPASRVKEVLRRVWNAGEAWSEPLSGTVARLVAERYGRSEWHARR